MNITVRPIGIIKSVFHYKNGTPRQSSLCENARGILTIEKSIFNNPEHSLEGLEQYSHAWVIFIFHKNNNPHTKAKVKPPRLDGQKVGVFSSRSPYRPNNIGLSLVQIDKIEGASVHLSGIDILDGTPVLDIKPYIPDYDKPKECAWFSPDEYSATSSMTESQKNVLLSKNDSEMDDSINSSDSCKNSNVSCDQPQGLSQSVVDGEEDINIDSVLSSLNNGSVANKNVTIKTENTFHQAGRESEQCHIEDEKFKLDSASRHPVAEGFYALSAALEKAGQSLRSGRNGMANASNEETLHIDADISKKVDPLVQCVDDGDDDVDILVGDILNKAAFDLTSLAQMSKTSFSPTVQREAIACDDEPVKPRFCNENVSKKTNKQRSSTNKKPKNDRTESVVVAPWLSKPPVSKLNVTFTSEAYSHLQKFSKTSIDPHFRLQMLSDFREAEKAIRDILYEEPRSVYRRQYCQDSLYYFTIDVFHVTCWFDEDTAQVVRVKPLALVPKLQQSRSPDKAH